MTIYDLREKRHIKKSVAESIVANLMGYIERHPIKGWVLIRTALTSPNSPTRPVIAKPYIPETLPMGEIPGLKFVPPAGTPRRRLFALPLPDFHALQSSL